MESQGVLPVLVVGAGPSGLMFAHELARYGVPCVLIEKDLDKSPFSRAIGVQIRTLEIFSALSLYEKLAEKSQAVSAVDIFAEGRKPITIPLLKTTSFFDRLLVIDQPHTELVLENALKSMGQPVNRGCELIDFSQDSDGITAVIQDQNGKNESKKFSYIIGADGAHSLVRKKIYSPFLGSTYDDAFILADAECHHPFDHQRFRIFFKNKRFLAMIPMHGDHHYRLISVRRGEIKKAGQLPTINEFHDLIKALVPFPLQIKNPTWVSRFFVQCRSAAHYQEGRAFLVGDAAHIHSPAGGQGMNTGLQDSFNLAWKLAMTIKGITSPTLLLSYHLERKPVGDFLIDRTDRLFKFMVKSSLWARLLRRFVLPRVAKSQALAHKLVAIGSQTTIRYEKGVLCDAEHQETPGIRIGTRVLNLHLISSHLKKVDLHTLVSTLNFSVIFFLPTGIGKKPLKTVLDKASRLKAQFPKGVQVHLIFSTDYDAEKSSEEVEYFVAKDRAPIWEQPDPYFVVLRPDHHVFCLGPVSNLEHAIVSLSKLLSHRGGV